MDVLTKAYHVENLQLLCPNCHALTDNYCGKNKEITTNKLRLKKEDVYGDVDASKIFRIGGKKRVDGDKFCPICGNKLKDTRNTYCSVKCAHKAQTKLPSDDKIREHILCGMTNAEIAKMYGVSKSSVLKKKKLIGLI